MKRKKKCPKELPSHIRKVIDAGIKDAKAGRVILYRPDAVAIDAKGTQTVTKVIVEFPIGITFFNDTLKPIVLRPSAGTHLKNPAMIVPCDSKVIYIQSGFLKLWEHRNHFQLMVE